tara:strand:+ start:6684 stop:8426 length:1743 start_codon:yes stop_codon:yes gene_type:complete
MHSQTLESRERFLFFTGKGGVGKTSLACAESVAMADAGKRVLLISTDPASNLDEVLETKLSGQPTAVEGVPGLFAMNIDPDEAAAAYRERIVGPYRGVLPVTAVANIEEQLSGACTTEIASFNEFSRLIGNPEEIKDFDHIVLDTAPTGHTLRLLNLPAAWNDFIAENKTGSSCLGPLSGLKEQKDIYSCAVETLKDPTHTVLVLVARAEPASLREAARAGGELREAGLNNQRLIVNAVFEAGRSDDPLASSLAESHRDALESIPESIRTLPCTEIPFRPTGAVGIDRIRSLTHTDQSEPVSLDIAKFPPQDLKADDLDTLVEELAETGHGVIMTMGKGGVGKTTLAVEIARRLASRGHSVSLATTDPADHVTGQFSELPENLTVEAIDPKKETERHVAHVLATTGANLDAEARELLEEELRSPCIEEIAVFTAFARTVAKGTDQFVVLDTAPTGHTLLLLDTTEAYHKEVSRNTSELSEDVRELLPRLRDPSFTRVLVVTLPEATPVHEAASLQEDLRRAGIEPWAWVINRTFYGLDSNDPLIRAKQRHEYGYLHEVVDNLSGRTAIIPYLRADRPALA